MKKILATLLTLALMLGCALALASCNQTTDFTVGVAQLAPHVALDAATEGFKDAAGHALIMKSTRDFII